MKKYILPLLATAFTLTACNQFNEANDAEKVEALAVTVNLDIQVDNLMETKDLLLKLDNYDDGLHYEKKFDGRDVSLDGVVPGIYTVAVSGTALDTEGSEYFINGNYVNKPLYAGETKLSITMQGLKVSPLVFKEIYYAGIKNFYFRDQFYEVYNNSGEVQYLDGCYFANLTPGKSTKTLPKWPDSDGNNYAYAERVWKFPGTGHDYPLLPGESAVISQFAANHKLDIYNPNSPVDLSHSEFEFNMDNPKFPDQPAIDMIHCFYNGKAEKGTVPQYLTSVFGGAYVIFRVPAGDTWDPVDDANMKTIDLNKPSSNTFYAKIPIKYVLDAVECIDNESMAAAKRVPAVLDAGMTWVGETYCGLGVARKVSLTESGDTIRRENGAIIFQDTNNSTDDFEQRVVPVIHRYGTGVPSWNVTY